MTIDERVTKLQWFFGQIDVESSNSSMKMFLPHNPINFRIYSNIHRLRCSLAISISNTFWVRSIFRV